MLSLVRASCVLAAIAGCSSSTDATPTSHDAGTDRPLSEGPREVEAAVTFDGAGISDAFTFVIPAKTRSVTLVVEGDPSRLFGIASFAMADGVERVGIDLGVSHAKEMKASYFDEQVGAMPGALEQSVRLGTFTHVYPYAPSQSLVSGTVTVRIASDGAAGSARVRVLMPEDDGASVLHLDVARISETGTLRAPPPFLEELRAIYARAGIEIVVDEVVTLPGTGYASLATFTEPQEGPDSDAARLATIVGQRARGRALHVMVVDSLPSGVAGLSLGVPGPPLPGSYYYGVVVADGVGLARVIAHEVGHFLGLQHVQNRGTSGKVYDDPLDDTKPAVSNLMTKGTELTPGQAFVLRRSPLLSRE